MSVPAKACAGNKAGRAEQSRATLAAFLLAVCMCVMGCKYHLPRLEAEPLCPIASSFPTLQVLRNSPETSNNAIRPG